MALSCTVSEADDKFSRKLHDIPTAPVLWASADGVLELGIGAGVRKKWNDGVPDGQKSFKIGLTVETQYRRVTDIQPAIFRQQGPHLRFAPLG